MQKLIYGILTMVLFFSCISVTSASESKDIKSPNQSLSVKDIVDPSYLTKYAGKYKTYEEVQKAAGIEGSLTKAPQKEITSQSLLKINSVDEYAAYVFYSLDQSGKEVSEEISDKVTPKALENWDIMIYDGKVFSIVGYADVKVNLCTITNVSAYSKLNGFAPVTQWIPDPVTISRPDKYTAKIFYSGTQRTGVEVGGTPMYQNFHHTATLKRTAICHPQGS